MLVAESILAAPTERGSARVSHPWHWPFTTCGCTAPNALHRRLCVRNSVMRRCVDEFQQIA